MRKDTLAMKRESSEPDGQELVYQARVSLDKSQMQIDDRLVNLSPGMAVKVEIKTGPRRIIEYLLSPFSDINSRPCASSNRLVPP